MARLIGVPVMALIALSAAPARAEIFNFALDTAFNGDTPTSTPPWLTASFEDAGTDTVILTLTSSLDVASEFIDEVVFNVNPAITPSDLTIAYSGLPLFLGVTNTTQDAQDLTGGGSAGQGFDVKLRWTTSTSPAANRFDNGDVVQFLITAAGLTAADFNFTNPSGLFVGAHVQGIPLPGGGTGSGAIAAVPEPASVTLMGLGLGGLALTCWRHRRK